MYKSFITACSVLLVLVAGCSRDSTRSGGLRVLKVAATPIPHAQLLEFVKPDLKEQGIDLKIVVVNDYNIPNRALAEKEVDANFFQHLPFLEQQIAQFHYPIMSLCKVEVEPMGIYSKKITDLTALKERDIIAIPNDPTNETRALLLLQKGGLIQLKDVYASQLTLLDIVYNPKQLQFHEVDAAMLARILPDVTAAAIPTNFAMQADLIPTKDALIREGKDSIYANIIAIRIEDENNVDLQDLKTAMTSDKMRQFILERYRGAVLPAF